MIGHGTSVRRLRDRRHSFAYLAPLSILPVGPLRRVDVMLGRSEVTTWVNVSAVARGLSRFVYAAKAVEQSRSDQAFLEVIRARGNHGTSLTVAPHVREMMALELMTPASLTDMVLALLDAADEDSGHFDQETIVVPGSEVATWAGS